MRCATRDAMRGAMRCELVAVAGEWGGVLLTEGFLGWVFVWIG